MDKTFTKNMKIKNWMTKRSMSEKLAIAMLVMTVIFTFVIGFTIFDLRKFNNELTNLNLVILPDITTSAELAASLQITLSNVSKLRLAESQAHRRITLAEINNELEKTKLMSNNIGNINISHDVLKTLLTTVENSVFKLNTLVENRITAKEKLDKSFIRITNFDLNHIAQKFPQATQIQIDDIINWEKNLYEIKSKAIQAYQTTRIREILKLKREALSALNEMPRQILNLPPAILDELSSVNNGLYTITHGPEGIFTLSEEHLISVARSRGVENQTSLLTEEASVLVSSIFNQTKKDAGNYAHEISSTLTTHTKFLIISSFFIFISFGATYYYFRNNLVGRLISLNSQILERVKGNRVPIKIDGEDEISDIGKSFGFFSNEIDSQQKKLMKAIKQAEKANSYKTEFLANISHDIRTPLTGVKGVLSLLSNSKLDAKQKKLLQKARLSSDILHSIINDLLDVSRLEKGMLSLHKDTVDIRELTKEVVIMMEDMKSEKGLDLHIDINKNIPDFLFLDPKRFAQILFNLLSNALKFTDSGSISIAIKAVTYKKNKNTLQLVVKDTGVGITKAQQKNVFERFQRLNKIDSRNSQSTGLGLSICKYLVELMNGKIEVKSILGEGSTFTVTIPYGLVTKNAKFNEKATKKPKNVAKDILVVEDNDINQQLIKMLLENYRHKVTMVSNGKEALKEVKKHNFDLVLMDVQMPVMGGKEATTLIRKLPSPKGKVPIIALTAHAMGFEADELIAIGMNAIITKPIDTKLLETAIQHYSL
jgi:signal transduction histidine kinase/CheY-like chemotaxis protein